MKQIFQKILIIIAAVSFIATSFDVSSIILLSKGNTESLSPLVCCCTGKPSSSHCCEMKCGETSTPQQNTGCGFNQKGCVPGNTIFIYTPVKDFQPKEKTGTPELYSSLRPYVFTHSPQYNNPLSESIFHPPSQYCL